MFEEIFSIIMNFVDIIISYINPITIITLTMEDLEALGKASIALIFGGLCYGVLNSRLGKSNTTLVLSICVGLMGTLGMPAELVILILILYFFLARVMEGFSSGLVLGDWLRRPFSRNYSVVMLTNQSVLPLHEIYSIFSYFFGLYGVYKLLRKVPIFQNSVAVPMAVAFMTTLGASALPLDSSGNSIPVLWVYPVCLLIGIVAGLLGGYHRE